MIDAAGRGTGEGLHLALNVGAMLISFLALVALRQRAARRRGGHLGDRCDLSLQQILGWVFAPVAWAMGVPWKDAQIIGNLLGTRMVLNEFVAYSELGKYAGRRRCTRPGRCSADRSEVVHDRDVRAVRLRELQLDRHPDRRHRRAGAEPAARPGAPRLARDARRHAGELHDGDDCGVPAVTATDYDSARAGGGRRFDQREARVARPVPCPTWRSCSGSGLGDFAQPRRRRRRVIPYERHPGLAAVDASSVTPASWCRARCAGSSVAVLSGRAHFYEGHALPTVRVRDPRARPCSA